MEKEKEIKIKVFLHFLFLFSIAIPKIWPLTSKSADQDPKRVTFQISNKAKTRLELCL